MNRKKLDKLWKAIADARRSLKDASDLESLAAMSGRTARTGGKHVMWISPFQAHRAFPISRHSGSSEVGHRPQKVILDHLEADAAAWEEILDAQEKDDGNENDDTSID